MNEFDYPSAPKKARIEIIPLIDVIFFLLATFVLFTLSLDKIGSIGVQLPVGGKPGEADTTVFIQTSEPGTLYWKQGRDSPAEVVLWSELQARLNHYKRNVAQPRVLVRGDNQAKFGDAVKVLDEVRAAGISQVSIETLVSTSGR
jgi:biopolymer transport protein ExbD